MTKFMKKGDTYLVTSDANLKVYDKLPVASYAVKVDPINGFYLQEVESYEISGKLYGDISKRADRILSTFSDRTSGTGLLLSGEKGCGKTLLAKLLSVRGLKTGMPTLVINTPFYGESFNQFIQAIDQPCVILFDEFEKVYSEEDAQNGLLTLLDGVYPTKKLFILTTNSRYKINQHMLNRPGRLFYSLEYTGLPLDFVKEYCEDNLINKTHVDSVVNYSHAFEHFNFDMLKALVEEMNRYNETAQEAVVMMNITAYSYSQHMHFKVTVDGKPLPFGMDPSYNEMLLDPMKSFRFDFYRSAEDRANENGWSIQVTPKNLVSIKNGVYVYEVESDVVYYTESKTTKKVQNSVKKHKFKLTLTKVTPKAFSYNENALAYA